jgi:S1-C subfamily serine protease
MKNTRRNFISLLLTAALLTVALSGAFAASADGAKQDLTAEETYSRSCGALLYVRAHYRSGSLKATGSGFIVSEDGLAVTAAHVVDKAAKVTVIDREGAELECSVLSCDAETDVALLRLPEGKYPALEVTNAAPASGAVLRAMGYPIKDTLIITEGLCAAPSAKVNDKERTLVTCDIVNGMSGGPVLDRFGRVVGLCSGSVRTMEGIHLAALAEKLFAAAEAAKSGK